MRGLLGQDSFGSGHFLIEAARQFSQKIIDVIDVADIPIENIKSASISEKRQLVQRYLLVFCIYGVDRSEACIDVAKFSIWLSTAMVNQPPLYLDFQLGTGSSLYGLTDIRSATKSDRAKLEAIAKLRKKVRDKFLKDGAGPKFKTELQKSLVEISKLKDDLSDSFSNFNYGYALSTQQKIEVATRQRPFFWLREFPEIFIDGGFTVYATNPPYDQVKTSPSTMKFIPGESELYRLAKMTDLDIKDYTDLFDKDESYSKFQHGYKNLFEGFILLKNKILRSGGYYSLIVPNSILAGEQTDLIRKDLWSDRMKIVREYPEKDGVKKRVFKLRKVACAIIFAKKENRVSSDEVLFEVYNDANLKLPTYSGKVSYASSSAVDKKNLPIILLDEWQDMILEGISNLTFASLAKSDVREGELNENFNKKAIKDVSSRGSIEIMGTNRMEFFYFNKFPKQDIVQYCDLSKAELTKQKLDDFEKVRLAINGIAGTNDSRVLAAVLIESKTLLNSNVNYILSERFVGKRIDVLYAASLYNSVLFDRIIRVQKKTNHNSSALIAALPIIEVDSGNGGFDPKDVLQLNKLTVKCDGRILFARCFHDWLVFGANLVATVGILKNLIYADVGDSILARGDFDVKEYYAIIRRFENGTIDSKDLLSMLNLKGKVALDFRRYFDLSAQLNIKLRELEQELLWQQNFALGVGILGNKNKARDLLSFYKIKGYENFRVLSEVEMDILAIKKQIPVS